MRKVKEDHQTILDEMMDIRIGEAFVKLCKKNHEFQKVDKEVKNEEEKMNAIGLNSHQWNTVDRVLSAYNARSTEYIKIAYKHGFNDALRLQAELREVIDIKKISVK